MKAWTKWADVLQTTFANKKCCILRQIIPKLIPGGAMYNESALVHDDPFHRCISTALCKTAVSPVLMHWRYCSLALSHRYILYEVSISSPEGYKKSVDPFCISYVYYSPQIPICNDKLVYINISPVDLCLQQECSLSCTSHIMGWLVGIKLCYSWLHGDMKMLSTLLSFWGANPPVNGGSPHKGLVLFSFDVSFVVSLNKLWTNRLPMIKDTKIIIHNV